MEGAQAPQGQEYREHNEIWRGDWDIVCPNHEKFPVLMRIVLLFPCILIRVNGSLTPGEAGLRLWVPWKLKFRSCGNQTNQRSVEVDNNLEGRKEGKDEALQIASRAFF